MRVGDQGTQTISARQLWLLLAASRAVVLTTTMPVITTGQAGRDAWIASGLATAVALIYAVLLTAFAGRLGRASFAEYSQRVLGAWLGKAAGLAMAALFLAAAYIRGKLFSGLISITALPNTPSTAIAIAVLLPPLFIAWRGLDSLGRAAEVAMSILAFSFLVVIPISTVPELDLRWLLPMLENGIRPVLSGMTNAVLWFLVFNATVLAAYPYVDQRQRVRGALILANVISGTILMMMSAMVIGQFGPAQAATLLSPVYSLVKNLQLGLTVRRFEIWVIMVWVPASSLALGLLLWSAARMVSGITSLQLRHSALILGAALVIAIAFPEPDLLQLKQLLTPDGLVTAMMVTIIAVPGLVWLVSLWRKPGHRGNRQGGSSP